MTAPIPEEEQQRPLGGATPPGEHDAELPEPDDATGGSEVQEENAETSGDQPSQ